MTVAPPEARVFPTEELLREAETQEGRSVSRRLLYDWTGLGLLDHPDRPGKGQGQGWAVEWPDSQRQLFLTLLRKRHEVKRIDTLCNVPVWIWLVWGEEYVPLRQARRALGTWAGRWKTSTKRHAYASAKALVAQLGVSGVPAPIRQVAVDAVARAAMTGEFDRTSLEDGLRRVMDPHRSGRPRGVVLHMRPSDYATLIEARSEARRRLSELDDDLFIWARRLYLVTRSGYAKEHSRLAEDPELGHIVNPPTASEVATNACLDLLTVLGYTLLSMTPHAPSESRFFDPVRSPWP